MATLREMINASSMIKGIKESKENDILNRRAGIL